MHNVMGMTHLLNGNLRLEKSPFFRLESGVNIRNTVSAVATQKSMRAEVSVVARMMRNAKLSSF